MCHYGALTEEAAAVHNLGVGVQRLTEEEDGITDSIFVPYYFPFNIVARKHISTNNLKLARELLPDYFLHSRIQIENTAN